MIYQISKERKNIFEPTMNYCLKNLDCYKFSIIMESTNLLLLCSAIVMLDYNAQLQCSVAHKQAHPRASIHLSITRQRNFTGGIDWNKKK